MNYYEEKLEALIEHMMLLQSSRPEITDQYIQGLKCAKALLHETDDINTMIRKVNDIFDVKNE